MTATRHCSRRDNGIGCFVGDNRARGLHANERVAPLNTSNAYIRVSRAQRCSDRVSRVDINGDFSSRVFTIDTRAFDSYPWPVLFCFILFYTAYAFFPAVVFHRTINIDDKCSMSRGKF